MGFFFLQSPLGNISFLGGRLLRDFVRKRFSLNIAAFVYIACTLTVVLHLLLR